MLACSIVRAGEPATGPTGVTYGMGVSTATVGAQGLCLELATLPPATYGRAHLHTAHESAAYVLSGEFTVWYGEALEDRVVARAGDFMFIPPGVPHLPANVDPTTPAVAVLARTDPHSEDSAVPLPELDHLPHLRATDR